MRFCGFGRIFVRFFGFSENFCAVFRFFRNFAAVFRFLKFLRFAVFVHFWCGFSVFATKCNGFSVSRYPSVCGFSAVLVGLKFAQCKNVQRKEKGDKKMGHRGATLIVRHFNSRQYLLTSPFSNQIVFFHIIFAISELRFFSAIFGTQ